MINIIPCTKVFFSVTKKEASFAGVLEAREAYNIIVDMKVKYGIDIILCGLINNKIEKNLNPSQKIYFYNLVTMDNTTSGQAGFNHSNCLVETSKVNSLIRKTIILSMDNLPDKKEIENNPKIVTITPVEFITLYKELKKRWEEVKPSGDFINYLIFVLFDKPSLVKDICESSKK